MENITIEATERTPEIDFDFNADIYRFAGESYPENVSEFYDAPVEKLKSHLSTRKDAQIEFNFEFVYFNSSTAKVLFDLFELLDETTGFVEGLSPQAVVALVNQHAHA